MPTSPQLHFWNWDAPVLPKVVEELTRGWKGGELDLSRTIVLVPTSEAVRRLREALAVAVAEKDGAVVAPYVWHPESALMHGVDHGVLLTPLQEQLLWRAVLEEIRRADYAALFPTEPAAGKETWAAGVGEMMARLRASVGAGGLSLAEVAKKLSTGMDAQRWQELAVLEAIYLSKVKALELCDAQEVKRERERAPLLPEGVTRLCVMALADPTPLLRQWIAAVAQKIPADIFVHAPPDQARHFDEAGAPLLAAWKDAARQKLEITDEQLHLAADSQQQARTAVGLLKKFAGKGMSAAVGLADPLLAPHFEGALSSEGVRAFDPAGRAASRHVLLEVLRAWQKLAQSRTFRSLSAFLRLDDVLRVVAPRADFSQSGLLRALDEFYGNRLPPTLDEALLLSAAALPREDAATFAKLNRLFRDIAARLEAWQVQDAGEAVRGLLEWIYGARPFETAKEDDRGYTFLFGEVMRLAEEASSTTQRLRSKAGAGDLLQTMLRTLQNEQLPDTRGEVDLVLQGWLELLWEPAAALVVCGFNDESVPGKIAPDPFLPDHVREVLGLACQASRRARDLYLLTALAAQRRKMGALHLVIGQTNDEGDVLRPSRLLFACDDAALPERIQHLFPQESLAPAVQQPAHSIPWKLAPWRVAEALTKVNTSLLAKYLRCPLRCGLEEFLEMSAVEAAHREMTAGDFGTLVHEVLGAFGREEKLRDSVSEKEIGKYLDETLDDLALKRWGPRPLLSTALQVEAARQRLAHAARVQAKLRNEGWRIQDVELKLEKEEKLELAQVPFTARLDRVDVNPQTGVLRVWDYKTRHKNKSPLEAHSETVNAEAAGDEAQQWKHFVDAKGKTRVWTDLQLPLYVWALRKKYPKVPRIEAGYIHLPAAVTESEEEIWTELDDGLIESAHCCAEEVVRRMKEGIFWPPADDVSYDAFEEVLLGDAFESIVEAALWKGDIA